LKTFTPGVMTRDILRPQTRQSIAQYLSTEPKTYDGHPIVAIRQSMFCEPTEDLDPRRDPVQICDFENLITRTPNVTPFVKHSKGYGSLWSGEVTTDHMAAFRDPYFMLSHDETHMRLINTDLMVLTDPAGSAVEFYHFANGSLMLSTELVSEIAAEDWDKNTWQGALVTAIFSQPESQHQRIKIISQLSEMNGMMHAVYGSLTDNFEDVMPERLNIDFKKFA